MKKLLYLVLAISMISFVRCSEEADPKPDPDTDPDTTATVTINVTSFTATLAENATEGTAIGTISVTTNATSVTYNLTNETPDGAFTISAAGVLSVFNAGLYDFESNQQLSASVVVNSGDVQAQGTITVLLTNVMEITMADFEATIDEHSANGTIIGTMDAQNGSSGALSYSLSEESVEGALTISSASGELTVANDALLEFDTHTVITATVSATNGIDLATASITVTLREVMELNPIDLTQMEYRHVDPSQNPFFGIDPGSDSYPSFVDLDLDGDLDMVIGSLSGTFGFAENRGEFITMTGTLNPFNGLSVGSDSRHTFADVDGDGDEDLISGSGSGDVNYFQRGNTGFVQKTGSENPFNGFSASLDSKPAFSDVDDDGDQDLVLAGFSGAFKYYENTGSGTFSERTGSQNPFGDILSNTHAFPVFVDLDNDGDEDLVSGKLSGYFDLYLNDSGTYSLSSATYPFNSITVGTYSSPAFFDLDGDGDKDMASGNGTGSIVLFSLEAR